MSNFKSAAARVGRALGSSTAASAVDVIALLVLARTTHLAAGVAAALACVLGGAVNFALNRTWVFADDAPSARGTRGGNPLRQLALYSLLVVIGGALLGGAVVQLATVTLGLSLLAAKAVSAVLVFVGWNYPVASFVVFNSHPLPPSKETTS